MTTPTQAEINAAIARVEYYCEGSCWTPSALRQEDIAFLVSIAKEVEQLRKENKVLLGDLQSCQARHEALVNERDQLKLHVQALREALAELWNFTEESHKSNCSINDPSEPSCNCGHEQMYRRLEHVIPNALSTTPSLNDYVPRSVADIVYRRALEVVLANKFEITLKMDHLRDAFTTYELTQKEHNV